MSIVRSPFSVNSTVYRDQSFNSATSKNQTQIPIANIATTSPAGIPGSIIYNVPDSGLYLSNGISWNLVGGNGGSGIFNNITINGGIQEAGIIVASSNTILTESNNIVLVNSNAGPINITLPTGSNVGTGQMYTLNDVGRAYGGNGSSTNAITLIASGSDAFLTTNGAIAPSPYLLSFDGVQVNLKYAPASITGFAVNAWVITSSVGSVPENLTIYVSTTGSDSNSGLTAGAPLLTIQNAVNVACAIGWDTTAVISNAAGTFNATNLVFPRCPYGRQQYPLEIKGTLTTIYTGTFSAIAQTYTGATVPDPSQNYTFTGTVAAASASAALRGAFLFVTSGVAQGYGWFVYDNTNISSTSESYAMSAFAGQDTILPAPGDSYILQSRGTTINLTGSPSYIYGQGATYSLYFHHINIQFLGTSTCTLNCEQQLTLMNDVALVSTVTGGTFNLASPLVTGMSTYIYLLNYPFLSVATTTDHAGIYMAGFSGQGSNSVVFSLGNGTPLQTYFSDLCFRQVGINYNSVNRIVYQYCVLNDCYNSFNINNQVSFSSSLLTASSAATQILLQIKRGSVGVLSSCYAVASGASSSIVLVGATQCSLSIISSNVTGFTQIPIYAVVNQAPVGSFYINGCNISYNTDGGIGCYGGTCSVYNSTVSNNGGDGIYAEGCYVYISTNTVSNNSGYGVHLAHGATGYVIDNTISSNTNSGIYLQNGCMIGINANVGTANGTYGMQLTSAQAYQTSTNSTITGATNDVKVGNNAATTWTNINGHQAQYTCDFVGITATSTPTFSILR